MNGMKSATVTVARFKSMPPDHPIRVMVDKWKPNNRLKLKIPVLIAEQLNHKLPEEREVFMATPGKTCWRLRSQNVMV